MDLTVLDKLDVPGRTPASTARPQADIDAEKEDTEQLAELNVMWTARDASTPEYRKMRRDIEVRIKERQRRTTVRPVVEVLHGVAGPDARGNWGRLEERQDYARINAIYRFLFAAVIPPPDRRGRELDYERIEIDPNPLT